MLHILLMILKIIGIILLAILGILILLLLLVNFVPARYRITAESKGDWKTVRVNVKFSWLLHLISGQVVFEHEKLDWKVRVAWKKLPEAKPIEQEHSSGTECKQEPEIKKEADETQEQTNASNEQKKRNIFEKIKYTIQKICDKIKAVLNMKDKIVDFLKDNIHITAFLRIKKEVVRLAGFLKPKKIKGQVRFGMEDPYTTGQSLAVLSVCYPFYGENVEIYPEFNRKILEGELYIKGHIRGVYVVIVAWNLVFDKNVRTMVKNIKTLK